MAGYQHIPSSAHDNTRQQGRLGPASVLQPGVGGVQVDMAREVVDPNHLAYPPDDGGIAGQPIGLGDEEGGSTSMAVRVNAYDTTVALRLDVLAALAYVLGPVTGVLVLIFEQKNDYVRFHAWQSSLTFAALMVLHFVLLMISDTMVALLFIAELCLIIFLMRHAYIHADTLQRYKLPYVGEIAERWLEEE